MVKKAGASMRTTSRKRPTNGCTDMSTTDFCNSDGGSTEGAALLGPVDALFLGVSWGPAPESSRA